MSRRYISAAALCALLAVLFAGCALNARTEAEVRTATMEMYSTRWEGDPGNHKVLPQIFGTAFAIRRRQFATAAHSIDQFIDSRFPQLLLKDSSGLKHEITRVLSYSGPQDFAVIELVDAPDVATLQPARDLPRALEAVQFVGHRGAEGMQRGDGNFSDVFPAVSPGDKEWVRFTGDVWHGLSGGPLMNHSWQWIGMVAFQGAPKPDGSGNDPNGAVPVHKILEADTRSARIDLDKLWDPLGLPERKTSRNVIDVPLPQPFNNFVAEVGRRRKAFYDATLGTELAAPRETFVITGPYAQEHCEVLNGQPCTCPRPPEAASGKYRFKRLSEEMLSKMQDGLDVGYLIQGAIVVRSSAPRSGPVPSVLEDTEFHRERALGGREAQRELEPPNEDAATAFDADAEGAPHTQPYTDSSNRTWAQRVWALKGEDFVVVSLARNVRGGHVVLTRMVPTAYEYGAVLQLKVVANLAYACPGD